MQIIDNLLPDHILSKMQEVLLGSDFPWYYSESVIVGDNTPNHFQMTHGFYWKWEWTSQYGNLVFPLLDAIKVFQPVKIKANLTFRSQTNDETGWHIDFNLEDKIQPLKTAVFYLNTTDGPTLFRNGAKCDCVANRVLIFDNGEEHTGTLATDSQQRVVLNINYYDL